MKDCPTVDSLVTPYVDGETSPSDRDEVAAHLDACPPCRRHARLERETRELVREHAPGLVEPAPRVLHRKCRRAAADGPHAARAGLRARRWPLAVAATVLLAVAGAVAFGTLVNPSVAIAAQLTLDHLKCFALFEAPAALEPSEVREALRRQYGWDLTVPDRDQIEGLSLVGGRHCLYLDGSLAHLLYRKGAVPVSVFVLPQGERLGARVVDVMGYAAVSFDRGGRTWVVLARQDRTAVEQMANRMQEGND